MRGYEKNVRRAKGIARAEHNSPRHKAIEFCEAAWFGLLTSTRLRSTSSKKFWNLPIFRCRSVRLGLAIQLYNVVEHFAFSIGRDSGIYAVSAVKYEII